MALPEPTTDLDRHKADLDEFGYCIVADALSAEQATALKERTGHVWLVGTKDTRALDQARGTHACAVEDGFKRVKLLEVRGLGHEQGSGGG